MVRRIRRAARGKVSAQGRAVAEWRVWRKSVVVVRRGSMNCGRGEAWKARLRFGYKWGLVLEVL
jgi:hypothetical protein